MVIATFSSTDASCTPLNMVKGHAAEKLAFVCNHMLGSQSIFLFVLSKRGLNWFLTVPGTG